MVPRKNYEKIVKHNKKANDCVIAVLFAKKLVRTHAAMRYAKKHMTLL